MGQTQIILGCRHSNASYIFWAADIQTHSMLGCKHSNSTCFWVADNQNQAILGCRHSDSSYVGLQTSTLKVFWLPTFPLKLFWVAMWTILGYFFGILANYKLGRTLLEACPGFFSSGTVSKQVYKNKLDKAKFLQVFL